MTKAEFFVAGLLYPYFSYWPEEVQQKFRVNLKKPSDGSYWTIRTEFCPKCGMSFPVAYLKELKEQGKNFCASCGTKLKKEFIQGKGFKLVEDKNSIPIRLKSDFADCESLDDYIKTLDSEQLKLFNNYLSELSF